MKCWHVAIVCLILFCSNVYSTEPFTSDAKNQRREEESKPERFSWAKWIKDRDEARMTPELHKWAKEIADIDRSTNLIDWAELRAIKNQYNLFNPTPQALRREFITDRPDKTINPVTVDAGHFQVETDFITATFDRRQPRQLKQLREAGIPVRTGTGGFFQQQPFTPSDKDDYIFLFSNLRVGLTNNIEAHLFVRPAQYLTQPSEDGQPAQRDFGTGDIRVLFKENLWGNEGGVTAFSLTQYLDLPAGQPGLTTGVVEGGVTGTYLLRFPEKTYIGFETGVEMRKDIFSERYHLEIPASISLAFPITKELSGKAEFAAVYSFEPGATWVGVISLALLYELGDDLQVDIGINIGVTPAANDWNPFVGIARRF